jgi:hypothetical protein
VRLVLTGLVFLLIAVSPARAETGILVSYDDSGDPEVTAGVSEEPGQPNGEVVELRACPPDGSNCIPLPTSAYTARQPCDGFGTCWPRRSSRAYPGATAPGTVFEAAFDQGGTVTTKRSPAWTGRVTPLTPVTVEAAAVGAKPRIVPGVWAGGWQGESIRAFPGFRVCRSPSGVDCWAIYNSELPQRWAGWHLFVDESFVEPRVDNRLFPELSVIELSTTPVPLPYPQPSLGPVRPLSTRSGSVQVCCMLPPPAPAATPTPPASPSATVRARAQRRKGALLVADVTCPIRCSVRLAITARGTFTRTLRVQGTRALSIPRRSGALRVRVFVDGKLLASGRSRAR